MKILFICSSLEPGYDGVGDYTRLLSCELIKQQHQITAIALNDASVNELMAENQQHNSVTLPVLRIPAIYSTRNRFTEATKYINAFKPDWISLQFVSYGFHKRGIPLKLPKWLASLDQSKWHIMFHELWIGKVSVGRYIISTIQEYIITSINTALKPKTIHTSIPFYVNELKKKGIQSTILPIFSTVSYKENINVKSKDSFRIAFFSQVIVEPAIFSFLIALEKQLSKIGKQLDIIFIGGQEDKVKTARSELESHIAFQNKIRTTGFLTEEAISLILQTCDLGITPVPVHALGKSTTVAAFLRHGIPVAAPVRLKSITKHAADFPPSAFQAAILQEPDLRYLATAAEAARSLRSTVSVEQIASVFMADLQQHE